MKNHLFDILLSIPLVWGMIRGIMRGFVFELSILIALIFGGLGSFMLAGKASEYLSKTFEINSVWLPALSHVLMFSLIFFLIILLGKALTSFISMTGFGIFNRSLGAVFGLVKWMLIVSMFVFLINKFISPEALISKNTRENSYLFYPLVKVSDWVYDTVSRIRAIHSEEQREKI